MKKFYALLTVLTAIFVAGCSDSADGAKILTLLNGQQENASGLNISFIPVEVEQDSRTILPGKGSVLKDLYGSDYYTTKSKVTFTFNGMPKQASDGDDYNVCVIFTASPSDGYIRFKDSTVIPSKFLPYIDNVDISYHYYQAVSNGTDQAEDTAEIDTSKVQLVGELKNVNLKNAKNVKLPINYKCSEGSNGKIDLTINLTEENGWKPQTVKDGQIKVYVWSLTNNDATVTAESLFTVVGTAGTDETTGDTIKKDITALKIGSKDSDSTELTSGYYRMAIEWKNYVMIDGSKVDLESINFGDIVFFVSDGQTTTAEISPVFISKSFSRAYFSVNAAGVNGDGASLKTPCEFWSLIGKIISGKNAGNELYDYSTMLVYGSECSVFNVETYWDNFWDNSFDSLFEGSATPFEIKYMECIDTPVFYRESITDYGLKFNNVAHISGNVNDYSYPEAVSITAMVDDQQQPFKLYEDSLRKIYINPSSNVGKICIYVNEQFNNEYICDDDSKKTSMAFITSSVDTDVVLYFLNDTGEYVDKSTSMRSVNLDGSYYKYIASSGD